ncbi:MAG: family 43 glycosylhydrolase [Actinomycetota bacterium]|nr:family 43 glycosylhydrolase [Actinomycetota bacterium]
MLATAAAASAWTLSYHDPLRDPQTGMPLSCPDPSVSTAPTTPVSYALVCTSGFKPDAFPIYVSRDLVHWHAAGFVFPHGRQPWWAVHSTGHPSGGRYWAPEINRIQGRWVIYFAAEYNSARLDLQVPGRGPLTAGEMMIGSATATSLAGPWHTAPLHYAGQFNDVSSQREDLVSAIDPSLLQDPVTGQLYLYWSDQSTQIWAGELSPDGVTLQPQIRRVLQPNEPFECDPGDHNHCTVEAPEPFYANGAFYLLYSGASTWDSSYAVGVASASDPFGPFVKLGHPILRQGNGFYSTGHTSEPVLGPDGNTYILYHARLSPGVHRSAATRYLMLASFGWANGWPTVTPGP